jgi:hypothetical protein
MEGNRIVFAWGCTENGMKKNCVDLRMYRERMEMELCWFGDVQRMEGNRILFAWGCTENGMKRYCVDLNMYREWKEMELCWIGDVQRMAGNIMPKGLLHMNLESTRPNVDQEIDGKIK